MEPNNINIIVIKNMINSAIQQATSDSEEISISRDNLIVVNEFIEGISDRVELLHIKNSIINHRGNSEVLIQRYLTQIFDTIKINPIEGFNEDNKTNPWGNKIASVIDERIPYRNQIIELIFMVFEYNQNQKTVYDFFKKLLQLVFDNYDSFQHHESSFYWKDDHFRVFIYEIFLYTSAYLIKNEKINELHLLIDSIYQMQVIHNKNSHDAFSEYKSIPFEKFNMPVYSLNDIFRKRSLNKNDWEDLYTEQINKNFNSFHDIITFSDLVEADILLYYISLFRRANGKSPTFWVPQISKSFNRDRSLDFMKKAASSDFFMRILKLFGANSIDEFNKLYALSANLQKQHTDILYTKSIPEISDALNIHFLNNQL